MSKTKKVATGKSGKKSPAKKPVRPQKVAAKKPATPVKKALKKTAAKAAPAKKNLKVAAKKVLVKVAKKVNKVVKKLVAPKSVKKAAPAKKAPAKNTVVKTALKSLPAKKINGKPLINSIKTDKKQLPLKPATNGKLAKTAFKAAVPADKKEEKIQTPKASTTVKKQEPEKKNEVLAITNTIPVKQANEISASKIASISYAITNPVKKTDSYAIKPEKEPNGKFELEFVVHASAEMLYEFLSTPSGLSEWFCDDLNIRNGIYTFIWDDQLQQARLLKTVDQQLVRFQWVDKTDGSYFEFKIQRDDLTNDISLIITDFADSVSDRESSKLLWNSQVEKLMHVIGSIF